MRRGHQPHAGTPVHPQKSIKIEIATIIAVTLIGLLIFILLLSNTIITAGFSGIETGIAEDNVNRAQNALNADVERLDGIANAWASSEEIESFIHTGNSAIPRQVFSDGRLLDSSVNILVISDTDGNVLWHKFMNLDYGHQSPTPKSLLEQIEKNAGLTQNGQAKGLVLLTSGPMILASRPIYAGTDTGTTGLLTVGRYLDAVEVSSLSDITQLDLSFTTLNLTKPDGGAMSAGGDPDDTGTIFIEPSGDGDLVGSTVLDDIYGEPVAVLSVRMPRDITEYGAGVLQYQFLSILLAGLVFGIVTLLLIQRSVVSRLEDLNRQVNRIGDGTDNTERVVIPGEDEIAYLGYAINDMLDSIEESREEYRRLFEEASDLILNLDADGRIISANRKTERITGFDRDVLRGMPFRDLLPEDTADAVMQSLLACSGWPGASTKEEVTIETRERGERILELSVQAHSWGENTGGLFIIARDVTRKKEAEEELRQHRTNLEEMVSRRTEELEQANEEIAAEKKKLSVTLRSITDGVITTDATGAVVLMNPAATDMLGLSSADTYGTAILKILDFTPEGSQRSVDDLISAVIQEKRPVECNGDLQVPQNDTTIPVMLSVAPIVVAGADVGGCVVVFRDISERIRYEEEMMRRQKTESIGILAGGIAHDFNNILTAITGNITIAKDGVPADGPVSERLTEAEKAAMRAKDITAQLITFSKGGAPIKETANIREMIRDVAEFVSHGSTVRVHCDIACNLKPVDVDTGQISQVIENFVINAIQAMPDGGNIYVSAKNEGMLTERKNLAAGEYISVAVADEGTGITPENMKKIFDPYFTTKKGGNGIGLASCLSIIRKHSGTICVESKPGTGSTFTMYLPVSENPVVQPDAETGDDICGRGRVLLMDDDINICELIPTLLRSYGFDVDVATDGSQAVMKYQEAKTLGRNYDVYIFDLTVPGGLGGVDTIRILREFEPDIKAIVSSGYSDDPVMANYADYGFSAVLPKPYQAKDLVRMIKRLLRSG